MGHMKLIEIISASDDKQAEFPESGDWLQTRSWICSGRGSARRSWTRSGSWRGGHKLREIVIADEWTDEVGNHSDTSGKNNFAA